MTASSASTTSTEPATMSQTPDNTPVTAEAARLGTCEQFAIGISSGMLAASDLSTRNWFLVVVLLPFLALELWDFLRLTFLKPDIETMKKLKQLRIQQFGYGVISGSAVSNLVTDLMLRTSIYTAMDVILYSALILGWATFWTLPSLYDTVKNLEAAAGRLETALTAKKHATAKKRKTSATKRHHKKISLPLGDNTRTAPSRMSSFASSA